MRHRHSWRPPFAYSAHRKALFSNLVAALFYHERIRTTDAKAKETRRLAERTITWARRVSDVLGKKPDRRSDRGVVARVVHAVRMARRVVRDRGAVVKLFDELAPRFFGRQGGYTRIVKLPQRPGDAAPMSLLELMPDEGGAVAKPAGKGDKGRQGRPAPRTRRPRKGAKAQAKGAEKPAKKAPKKYVRAAEGPHLTPARGARSPIGFSRAAGEGRESPSAARSAASSRRGVLRSLQFRPRPVERLGCKALVDLATRNRSNLFMNPGGQSGREPAERSGRGAIRSRGEGRSRERSQLLHRAHPEHQLGRRVHRDAPHAPHR